MEGSIQLMKTLSSYVLLIHYQNSSMLCLSRITWLHVCLSPYEWWILGAVCLLRGIACFKLYGWFENCVYTTCCSEQVCWWPKHHLVVYFPSQVKGNFSRLRHGGASMCTVCFDITANPEKPVSTKSRPMAWTKTVTLSDLNRPR